MLKTGKCDLSEADVPSLVTSCDFVVGWWAGRKLQKYLNLQFFFANYFAEANN